MERRFDYLVIGGGAAGAVLARRLVESTTATVALLEAGPSDEGLAEVADFTRYKEVIEGPLSQRIATAAVPGTDNRIVFPLGRVLGGCTSHNTCIWFRPPDEDFRDWEAAGAAGWGPRALDPHFDFLTQRIKIRTAPLANETQSRLFQAARESGFPEIDFARSFGAGVGLYRINTVGVQRQSASVSFLHPLSALPERLAVFTDTEAQALIFADDGTIAGVETTRGRFLANAEVVLAAGALNTPKLLMLSGIGPAAQLREHGIAVRHDLPGIGQHLLDHPAATVDAIGRTPPEFDPTWAYSCVVFADVVEDGTWPDIEIQLGPDRVGPRADAVLSAYLTVNRARSEGTVRLASADPRADLVVDANYFGDPDGYDLRVMLSGVRQARRIFQAPALASWIASELRPGEACRDDAELAAYLRETLQTGYHPAGTCRMGALEDPRSVVGPDLRVRGLAKLRIADASVFPTMVGVNIQAACMMVGTHAADLIAHPRVR